MNPTLYLSCLLVIIGSLSWTASAQDDQEFQSELERLNNIYGNDAVHRVTKLRNVPELMAFYEKHSERIQLTEAERQKADRALRQYKERNQRREEGLTPQGASWPWRLSPPPIQILDELYFRVWMLREQERKNNL